jgi:hypothetical protein
MRLELNLNSIQKLFVNANAVTGMTITNVRVVAKVYELSDTALKRLTFIASQTGLTLAFADIHESRQQTPNGAVTAVSLKSASKALSAFACVVEDADRAAVNADSSKLRAYDIADTFQFSLGSSYITSEPVAGAAEALIQANDSFGLWGRADDNVSNRVTSARYLDGYGVIATNLERSATLEYNGSAVSSSRPLLLQANLVVGGAITCHLFLVYLRLVTIFSDSNIVLLE